MYHLALSGDALVSALAAAIAAVVVAAIGAWASVSSRKETKQLAGATEQIAVEMKPNGGSTFRDAIDRLDRRSTAHDERFGRLEASNDSLVKSNAHLVEGQATLLQIIQRIERRQLGEEEEPSDPSAS